MLDEFPYLVDSAPALPSILQAWLDHSAPKTRIKLVLSGSHITAMRQLEGADQPLYGRRTRRLLVAPFAVREVTAFAPGYSPRDRLITYGALGGLPGHLALLDASEDIATNVRAFSSIPPDRFVDEAQHMLDAFLADAVVHYSIVEAIATGDQTWKGITNRTGAVGGALHRAIDWLVAMEVVERITPITERSPERSKRTLYRIADPYVGSGIGSSRRWSPWEASASSSPAACGTRPSLRGSTTTWAACSSRRVVRQSGREDSRSHSRRCA